MALYNDEMVYSYHMISEPFVLIRRPIHSQYTIQEQFELVTRPKEYTPPVTIPFYKKITNRIYTYYKNIPTMKYNSFNHPYMNLMDILIK